MKAIDEIIDDLDALKTSLQAKNQTIQIKDALRLLLDGVIDLAKIVEENYPHQASQKQTNEIFDD